MPSKADLLFGKIAVREGMVKAEQVMEAVRVQKSRETPEHLGRILLDLGYIDQDGLDELLIIQKRALAQPASHVPLLRKEDAIFGKIAVKKGFLKAADMYAALREQAELEAEGKKERIGEICVRMGLLTVENVVKILEIQKMNILVCEMCSSQYNVFGYKSGSKVRCAECGAVLSVPERVETLNVSSATLVAPKGPPGSDLVHSAATIADISTRETVAPDGSEVDEKTHSREFRDYEVIEEIARGGMGIVYKARQKRLNRVVALKVLIAGENASEELIRRFKFEAESAASLRHPNIVAIHDFGEDEGRHYFTMDFIEGQDLDELIRAGSLSVKAALTITRKVALALDYAHGHRMIHRDIKPKNIIVDDQGEPHITDFGLARDVESDASLTKDGIVMGTPAYMPPEQARGELTQLGPASDVYSLGATLYELLTGVPPFEAQNVINLMSLVINKEPVGLRKYNSQIPTDVETICLKALDKEIGRRYQGMAEFAEDIRRFLDGEVILARPASLGFKVWKKIKKNRVVSLVVLIALVMIISLSTTFLVREARKRAREAQMLADRLSVGLELVNQAELAASQDDYDAALDKFVEARERFTQALGLDPDNKEAVNSRKNIDKRTREIKLTLDKTRSRKITEKAASDLEKAREKFAVDEDRTTYKRNVSRAYDQLKNALELDNSNNAAANKLFETGVELANLNVEDRGFIRVEEILEDLRKLRPGDVAIKDVETRSESSRYQLSRFDSLIKEGDEYLDKAIREKKIISRKKEFFDRAILAFDSALGMKNIPDERLVAAADKKDKARYLLLRQEGLIEYELAKKAEKEGNRQQRDMHRRKAYLWLNEASKLSGGHENDEIILKLREMQYFSAIEKAETAIEEKEWKEALAHLMEARENTDDKSQLQGLLKKVRSEGYRESMQKVYSMIDARRFKEASRAVSDALVFQDRDPRAKTISEELDAMENAPEGMALVFSTSFVAGSSDPEDRNPEHTASVDAFYVSILEVTCAEYKEFVDSGAYGQRGWWDKEALDNMEKFVDKTGRPGPANWEDGTYPVGWEKLPVCGVSFYEAKAYARWKRMRLPTEDEWELAAGYDARSGRKRTYPWGDKWFFPKGSFAVKAPLDVGSVSGDTSPWKVMDMGGNVMEWTIVSPALKGGNEIAIIRGGSYGFTEDRMETLARITKRKTPSPFSRARYFGFRLIRDLKSK